TTMQSPRWFSTNPNSVFSFPPLSANNGKGCGGTWVDLWLGSSTLNFVDNAGRVEGHWVDDDASSATVHAPQ
ncbi:hypothetical protein KI387_013631, partial [Taxus chinensis]